MNSDGVKRTLDRLAYASLVLDICIAAITGLTVLDIQSTKLLLLPVDYILSLVVVLSAALFVVLLVMKTMENRSAGDEGKASASRGRGGSAAAANSVRDPQASDRQLLPIIDVPACCRLSW